MSPAGPSVASQSAATNSRRLIVVLVRHGETAWNAEQRLQGQTDVPLSEMGQEQARRLGRRLRRLWFPTEPGHRHLIPPSVVYVSDLSRASETSRLLLESAYSGHEVPPVHSLSELRERFFGKFEGLTAEEAAAAFPGETHHTAGETYDAVYIRMLSVLERAWTEAAFNPAFEAPTSALIVGHGGSLRTLIARAIEAGANGAHYFALGNTSITILEFSGADCAGAKGRIRLLNDTSHLEP